MSKSYTIMEIKTELYCLSLQEDWPKMATLLTMLYARLGLAESAQFAESLGLSRRTLQYLVQIATRFRACETDMPSDIPWRKIAEIVPGLNRSNIARRISYAQTHRRREIIAAIKSHQV